MREGIDFQCLLRGVELQEEAHQEEWGEGQEEDLEEDLEEERLKDNQCHTKNLTGKEDKTILMITSKEKDSSLLIITETTQTTSKVSHNQDTENIITTMNTKGDQDTTKSNIGALRKESEGQPVVVMAQEVVRPVREVVVVPITEKAAQEMTPAVKEATCTNVHHSNSNTTEVVALEAEVPQWLNTTRKGEENRMKNVAEEEEEGALLVETHEEDTDPTPTTRMFEPVSDENSNW